MVKIYKQPFAHSGDAIAIPSASQPDGKMSSADGWTPDYQLLKSDPNYKPVGRQEMNGVFKEVTEALGQVQQFGFADWQNITGGWPIGANVRHAGGYWQSLANANMEEPGAGALWKELLFSNLVPASEAIQGLVALATAEQAQALTADDVAITPKTLAEAFMGANGDLSEAKGYQIFPGEQGNRLMIQWGGTPADYHGQRIVYPVSFGDGASPRVVITPARVGIAIPDSLVAFTDSTNTGFTYLASTGASSVWIAIGRV